MPYNFYALLSTMQGNVQVPHFLANYWYYNQPNMQIISLGAREFSQNVRPNYTMKKLKLLYRQQYQTPFNHLKPFRMAQNAFNLSLMKTAGDKARQLLTPKRS